MSTVKVQLYRRENGTMAEAILHTDLKPSVLCDVEKYWGPPRLDAAKRLHRQGRIAEIPEHFRWDWRAKSSKLQSLAYRSFGIECDGKFQGLLMVKLAGQLARVAPDVGKDIVYINYLETAPWNLGSMVDTPTFGGVGSVLMLTAIQLSIDEGLHGRLGLHALPQAEEFYKNDFQMHDCGPDPNYEDLRYFEMTRGTAAQIISQSMEKQNAN